MLEGADIGRIRFRGEHMAVTLEGCIFLDSDAEVNSGGLRVGSPRVGAHIVTRSGTKPFGAGGESTLFPFRIGISAGVIDGKYGGISRDANLAVVLVPFAGTGEDVFPSGRFQI